MTMVKTAIALLIAAVMLVACAPASTPTCHTEAGEQRWLSLNGLLGTSGCGECERRVELRIANILARSDNGVTPLHLAVAHSNNLEIIQVLLDNGADIASRADVGVTPLHWADTPAVVQVLLDNGADIHAGDDFGMTPLHRAAMFSSDENPEVIQVLLDNGADIHGRDEIGMTPLHRACGDILP